METNFKLHELIFTLGWRVMLGIFTEFFSLSVIMRDSVGWGPPIPNHSLYQFYLLVLIADKNMPIRKTFWEMRLNVGDRTY